MGKYEPTDRRRSELETSDYYKSIESQAQACCLALLALCQEAHCFSASVVRDVQSCFCLVQLDVVLGCHCHCTRFHKVQGPQSYVFGLRLEH
jgi:hypothetical protein